MKIQTYEGSQERLILTAMVTSTEALSKIAPQWKDETSLQSKFSSIIGKWCVDYFNIHAKAPDRTIESIFQSWAENRKDHELVDTVEKFLAGLSEEYERGKEINPDHVINIASVQFRKNALKHLIKTTEGDLEQGHLDKAEQRVSSFHQVQMGDERDIDLFIDKDAFMKPFMSKQEPLFVYPGDVGRFFGNSLEREGFLSFVAPEKTGKTWMLIDLAVRAMLQRKKVAFFEVGDMSEEQVIRRFQIRATQYPQRAPNNKWPFKLKYPLKIVPPASRGELADVEYKIKEFEKERSGGWFWEKTQEVINAKGKSNKSYFRLAVRPNFSINVDGIKSTIRMWQIRDDFVPDVVVVDYADILAPPPGRLEVRDQINVTWKQLRNLSAVQHCLVVTATQANAKSYERDTIDRRHFSEDKRKMAHCTGMIGLNVTGEEKELGIIRLNWIVRREEDFSSQRCIYCAGNLRIGSPIIRSAFPRLGSL